MTHNNIKNLFETDWKMLSVKLTSLLLRKCFFVGQQDRRKIFSNYVVSVNYQSLLQSIEVGEEDHRYDVKFLFLA